MQGRTLWDPARLGLSPGSRIAYHLEARDHDEVSGAKIGTSRTLYVVIARPQESVDERLDRQRELLERLTGDLADRLEIPVEQACIDEAAVRLADAFARAEARFNCSTVADAATVSDTVEAFVADVVTELTVEP